MSTEQGLAVVLAFIVVSRRRCSRGRASVRAAIDSMRRRSAIGVVDALVCCWLSSADCRACAERSATTSARADGPVLVLRRAAEPVHLVAGSPASDARARAAASDRACCWHPSRRSCTLRRSGACAPTTTQRRRERSRSRCSRLRLGLVRVAARRLHAAAYVQPCWRVLLILGLLGARDRIRRRESDAASEPSRFLGVSPAVALVVGVCHASLRRDASAGARRLLVARAARRPRPLRSATRASRSPASGRRRSATDKRSIDAHRGPTASCPSLWSTYAGWLEARNGIFHPSFDYIIHALGPDESRGVRRAFRRRGPTLVQTVLPTLHAVRGLAREQRAGPSTTSCSTATRVYVDDAMVALLGAARRRPAPAASARW